MGTNDALPTVSFRDPARVGANVEVLEPGDAVNKKAVVDQSCEN